jgi:hypothetical protein
VTATRVVELKTEDLGWPFEGGSQFRVGPRGSYRTVKADPFPGYGHDPMLVREMAERVENAFAVGFLPTYYVLHHEAEERTNGHANRAFDYDGRKKPYPWEPWIVLSGKRIPPHPAMTRYLVAHEYGHVVQWWIEHQRGIEDQAQTTFDHEYVKMRPGASFEYGARNWHREVGELIANDFRICVTGIESEFWPHEGFEHPLKLDVIRGFWARMKEEFAFRPAVQVAQGPGVCNEKSGEKKAA